MILSRVPMYWAESVDLGFNISPTKIDVINVVKFED